VRHVPFFAIKARLVQPSQSQESGDSTSLYMNLTQQGDGQRNRSLSSKENLMRLISHTRSAKIVSALVLLSSAFVIDSASAHDCGATIATSSVAGLSPADYTFVAQANLGAPFQVESGRVAERKTTTAEVRDYARLMVESHIPVIEALNKILARKDMAAPANPLLRGAYDAMIEALKADQGAAFNRNYVTGQVEYQKGNAALFQSEIRDGNDPDLKAFARQTLPKIEDHLKRVVRLAKKERLAMASSEQGVCVLPSQQGG
jgi:putative membrane protein